MKGGTVFLLALALTVQAVAQEAQPQQLRGRDQPQPKLAQDQGRAEQQKSDQRRGAIEGEEEEGKQRQLLGQDQDERQEQGDEQQRQNRRRTQYELPQISPSWLPDTYRTIDGSNNNPFHPTWGQAGTQYLRKCPPEYGGDGKGSVLGGEDRPHPRLISNWVLNQNEPSIPNVKCASDYMWLWGQFIDHDMSETPPKDPVEEASIDMPKGDNHFDPSASGNISMVLHRSNYELDSEGVRQQMNAITAYIDGSMVYGSDHDRADFLRANDGSGKLKVSDGAPNPEDTPLLQYNTAGLSNHGGTGPDLFIAGDVRSNEQVALTAIHTVFVLEHNWWCDKINNDCVADRLEFKSAQEKDEYIYQQAKLIVCAEIQSITYNDFLPTLLGKDSLTPYAGYKPHVNPSIANEWATAGFRVGHTMVTDILPRLTPNLTTVPDGHLPLKNGFFNPSELKKHGIESLLRGLAYNEAQRIDLKIVHSIRNFLFGMPHEGGFDLGCLNIQRGRDHGLGTYNSVRKAYGLEQVQSIRDIPGISYYVDVPLALMYGTEDGITKLDAWVAMLSESPSTPGDEHGPMVGPTLQRILADQFERTRDGDRYFYKRYLHPKMIQLVESQKLSDIFMRTTKIMEGELPKDVFRYCDKEDTSTTSITTTSTSTTTTSTTTTALPTTTTTQKEIYPTPPTCNACYGSSSSNPCLYNWSSRQHSSPPQLLHPHCNHRKYIQCSRYGRCHERECGYGTVWNQRHLACVHGGGW